MITTKLKGGLGNQMFQYAIGRALAERNKSKLFLDVTALNHRLSGRKYVFRSYVLDIFQLEQNFTFLSKLSWVFNNLAFVISKLAIKFKSKIFPTAVKFEQSEFAFSEDVANSPDGTYLDGYWQHFKYFSNISEIIKNDFAFKNKISDGAEPLLQEIKQNNSVCIHVRRGDYVSMQINQDKFAGLTRDYYNNGIKYLEDKFPGIVFYVFSDDLAWCKENLVFSAKHNFVGPEYEGEKLRDYFELMQSCKNFIISNSTFSWWAAWLSPHKEKVVIAPKFWLNDKSVDTGGLLLPEWIKI